VYVSRAVRTWTLRTDVPPRDESPLAGRAFDVPKLYTDVLADLVEAETRFWGVHVFEDCEGLCDESQ
jgi:hypothetical protein